MPQERWDNVKKFAQDHWPEALAATITFSGAATWLLIRYYKQKQLRESTRVQLDVLEKEASLGQIETAVLLETGESAMEQMPGSSRIAKIMAPSIPDPTGQETMNTLGEIGIHSRPPKQR